MASVSREKLQQPQTLILLGLIGLVLTYAMATRSIDTGSLGQYALTFLLLWLSLGTIVKAVRAARYGNKR